MADLAAPGSPEEADLADRKGREIVVQQEFFLGFIAVQVIQPLGIVLGPQGHGRKRLGFAAGEYRRAVDTGQDAQFNGNGPDLVKSAVVGSLLVLQQGLAEDLGLHLFKGALDPVRFPHRLPCLA